MYMTSTQAQEETKMNEITNTRTAIKNARHNAGARTNSANMAVTTFTDEIGEEAKLASGHIGTGIASVIISNEIRSNDADHNATTWTSLQLIERYHGDKLNISTSSKDTFGDNGKTISVMLTEGKFMGIGGSGSTMGMILKIETAKQIVAALSAQIAANEA